MKYTQRVLRLCKKNKVKQIRFSCFTEKKKKSVCKIRKLLKNLKVPPNSSWFNQHIKLVMA